MHVDGAVGVPINADDRWLFPDRLYGGSQLWFWVHIAAQLFGLLLFLSSFILALVTFKRKPTGMDDSVYLAHSRMGYLVAALAGLQLLVACFRPPKMPPYPETEIIGPAATAASVVEMQLATENPDAPAAAAAAPHGPQTTAAQQRQEGLRQQLMIHELYEQRKRAGKVRKYLWNPFHRNCGRGVILLAWATLLTGIALHHGAPYNAPVAPWAAPAIVVMVSMLLADRWLTDVGKDLAEEEMAKANAEWRREEGAAAMMMEA
ncbi:hypothetical protein VOLCADRAFT_85842 [Volvox carteri f. nagariensis]|uniref:Cytochrome b561 domain-containing protein n=1 Tax=Volvox carteri f. nagariensis TaxID=3068 RepID=D8TH49_VOLCA|nr:uncharacterized protein VOLCADRAFT_85842 [Volvox carteri f. nagariensis]EFJ53008.1 hypothetical protein VOLCADRAFT_85842 [Volvox carteri f. nagariensis]|eukprot:XP_002946013.1 hypothetical protein VOLCADRAFT_85842 [Volvox carteri f. nagariensis]